jgi:hypothetical protein
MYRTRKLIRSIMPTLIPSSTLVVNAGVFEMEKQDVFAVVVEANLVDTNATQPSNACSCAPAYSRDFDFEVRYRGYKCDTYRCS